MTLTQQFIVVSILPLGLLALTIYLWRAAGPQPLLRRHWALALLLTTVWASSVLRYYGGTTFSPSLIFTWGALGHYALALAALSLLLSTQTTFAIPRQRALTVTTTSAIFLLLGVALDQRIWGRYLPSFTLGGQSVRQFDLWAAIWIVAWLLPLLTAWLLTQQAGASMSPSLARNKIGYWLLMLGLFFAGALLASFQQPGQPAWQEAGLLLILPAMLVGTLSIVRSQLPDLQLVLRRLLRRLSGTLIIFGLSWLALWFLSAQLGRLALGVNRSLLLVLFAALFAALFTFLYRGVIRLTGRLFLPATGQEAIFRADYADLLGYLPQPHQLAEAFLSLLHAHLNISDVWLFLAEEGPGGQLLLRSLASAGATPPEVIALVADSPFATTLRQKTTPLLRYEPDIVQDLAPMPVITQEEVVQWQRAMFVPVRTGNTLVGVLAPGPKQYGDLYSQADLQQLQDMVDRFSPLLGQSHHLEQLQQVSDYAFRLNQTLARDRQHLLALSTLYNQFLQQISPTLRRPLHQVDKQLTRLHDQIDNPELQAEITTLQRQLTKSQRPIDQLIDTAVRLQNRTTFHVDTVQLDDIARKVLQRLQTMAEARRVRVEIETGPPLPAIIGDEERLTEAVHHLLHNAIKFNKIGGVVTMTCGTSGGDVFLRILDTGVGIPDERLADIWTSFTTLGSSADGSSRKASLGLTLTYTIVTAHGGRLEAESSYGAGSVFALYLPLVLQE